MREFLLKHVRKLMARREPDFVIRRDGEKIYLKRWWITPRNPYFNIYAHEFLGNDEESALHDHMYVNMSYILDGGYFEHLEETDNPEWRSPGTILFRRPKTAHRIELAYRFDALRQRRVIAHAITIFITGPRVRIWGFSCPKGWIPYTQFVSKEDPGRKGQGCP